MNYRNELHSISEIAGKYQHGRSLIIKKTANEYFVFFKY